MFDDSTSGLFDGTGTIGLVIFFLTLFWIFFGGGMGGFGNGVRAANSGSYNNNESTPLKNSKAIAQLFCDLGRDYEVMKGDFSCGLSQLMNNENKNTAQIIDAQKDQYIRQLEQDNAKMFVTAQNEATRNQALLLNQQTQAQLETIRTQMAKQPPVYTASCIPCGLYNGCATCGGASA